jgi:hypothetical protein
MRNEKPLFLAFSYSIFGSTFGQNGFKVLGLWDGKAKAARNRSFGDVPDQPGHRFGPDYLGR